jgi:hypothetical protein
MSKEELLAKYWSNVDFSRTITRENAGKLLNILENLEDLDNVKRIVALVI